MKRIAIAVVLAGLYLCAVVLGLEAGLAVLSGGEVDASLAASGVFFMGLRLAFFVIAPILVLSVGIERIVWRHPKQASKGPSAGAEGKPPL
jgi:hypothetical protein